MRQMKYSGIEWIGKIPETWEVCKLNYIYRFQTGATPPSKIEKYFDGNIKWANIADLKSQYVYDTNKHLSEDGVAICNMNISPKGSLMYSFKLSVGAVAFCGCDMYTNEAIATFLEGHGNLHYLYYMAQVAIINNANYNIYGAPILNQDLIQNALVINPPLIDQQHIADYLDSKCGEIDSLIALQEQMIEKLKAYKQSVITEAVTKGLDPNAKLVPSGIDWIGDIPEGWSKDKVVRCFKKIGSGTTPKSTDDNQFQGDINWLQSGDINGSDLFEASKHISEQTLASYSALSVYQAPFIIIAMYGASVGNISISHIDACVNQACCVLNFSNLNFKFAFYALKSAKPYLIYRAEGGGQPNISQDKLKSLWIPRPPMDVQPSIASYLDSKCSDIDRLIALKQQKIESLKDYKKSVIYEAVTGKIEI